MRDEDIALGVLFLMVCTAERNGPTWGDGWMWPLPALVILADNTRYEPVISQEFNRATHAGVDIMYRRRSPGDRPEYKPRVFVPTMTSALTGSPVASKVMNGTERFFVPPRTPVIAPRDARVWFVAPTITGIGVVLDHGKPWATFYAHLETTTLGRHAGGFRLGTKDQTHVKQGDVIGTVGWAPNMDASKGPVDGQMLRHLHCEAWFNGVGPSAAQDPAAEMAKWEATSWGVK